MMVKVEDALTKLFNYYKTVYDSLNVEVRIEDEEMPTVVDDNDTYAIIASQFNTYLEGVFFNSSMSELDKYLTDVVEKVPKGEEGKFDLMNWWKVNSSKYKVLSLLARDVLAMPVSTVASESAFSTGGRILYPFRSSFNPETVEMLVCTQNWLQSNVPISLRKVIDDVEQIEQSFAGNKLISNKHVFFIFYDVFLQILITFSIFLVP
ncbi:hypothetical protein RHGRI_010699 [Rhododendron griersonianum]|nr:hypothetical protein RHGRI_010699 [Rhododendron griersonianum]